MTPPTTRREAADLAAALDRDILHLRRRGLHDDADRITRQRDAAVARWARRFDALDRGVERVW